MHPSELLDMKLKDISDLFLDRLNETGENCTKADLEGCCKNERFVLRVCLCKKEAIKKEVDINE